jgi:hypothetical protein
MKGNRETPYRFLISYSMIQLRSLDSRKNLKSPTGRLYSYLNKRLESPSQPNDFN